jgi:hypothetical protein
MPHLLHRCSTQVLQVEQLWNRNRTSRNRMGMEHAFSEAWLRDFCGGLEGAWSRYVEIGAKLFPREFQVSHTKPGKRCPGLPRLLARPRSPAATRRDR